MAAGYKRAKFYHYFIILLISFRGKCSAESNKDLAGKEGHVVDDSETSIINFTKPTTKLEPNEARVVGGLHTSIVNFPHQVSLQLQNIHICGGAILSEDIVVTAAHCVKRYDVPEMYSIRAGSSINYMGGVVMPVKAIHQHINFNHPYTLSNDIALVKLKYLLKFNIFIQPIPIMAEYESLSANTAFWITGWGAKSYDVPIMSPILQYTMIFDVLHEKCRQTYSKITTITSNMLCAGVAEGGRDSCQGDSGGPLVAEFEKKLKLIGIVSFGINCGKPQYPGVYTRVQNYGKWLGETMAQLRNS